MWFNLGRGLYVNQSQETRGNVRYRSLMKSKEVHVSFNDDGSNEPLALHVPVLGTAKFAETAILNFMSSFSSTEIKPDLVVYFDLLGTRVDSKTLSRGGNSPFVIVDTGDRLDLPQGTGMRDWVHLFYDAYCSPSTLRQQMEREGYRQPLITMTTVDVPFYKSALRSEIIEKPLVLSEGDIFSVHQNGTYKFNYEREAFELHTRYSLLDKEYELAMLTLDKGYIPDVCDVEGHVVSKEQMLALSSQFLGTLTQDYQPSPEIEFKISEFPQESSFDDDLLW